MILIIMFMVNQMEEKGRVGALNDSYYHVHGQLDGGER
jgi:hypothetical protein